MISRRRFLTISAAALAAPASATAPVRWQGQALGASASLTLHAPAPLASRAIAMVQRTLVHAESLYSLYREDSALARLNRTGILRDPHPEFLSLLRLADRVHHATGGAFDPTVQPLWQALATGGNTEAARDLIGWDRLIADPDQVQLAPGQALTLNGIAQGVITDQVARKLRAIGLRQVLVDIGEFAAIGGPWPLGVADPLHGVIDHIQLTDRAVATSSAEATRVGDQSHILDPTGQMVPQWSTVSVTAKSATLADAASTAFMLMSAPRIRAAQSKLGEGIVATLVDEEGQVLRI